MRRPAFQFYAADWRGNAKLRRCSHAERGIWIEVLCLMHDAEEYGVLRWPLKDIALAVNCRVPELRSLATKEVLKGGDTQIDALLYTPRHAGKDGEPVVLLPHQAGPVWYSSRMVRDEYVRSTRGVGTRFGDPPKSAPTRREGDGASTSSSKEQIQVQEPAADAAQTVWDFGVTILGEQGIPQKTARSFLASLLKDWDAPLVEAALRSAVGKAEIKAYVIGCLREKPKKGEQKKVVI